MPLPLPSLFPLYMCPYHLPFCPFSHTCPTPGSQHMPAFPLPFLHASLLFSLPLPPSLSWFQEQVPFFCLLEFSIWNLSPAYYFPLLALPVPRLTTHLPAVPAYSLPFHGASLLPQHASAWHFLLPCHHSLPAFSHLPALACLACPHCTPTGVYCTIARIPVLFVLYARAYLSIIVIILLLPYRDYLIIAHTPHATPCHTPLTAYLPGRRCRITGTFATCRVSLPCARHAHR